MKDLRGSTADLLKVFVYGTLKPGEFYYSQYCEAAVVEAQAAIAHGCLFHLPLGYPAMTVGQNLVYGFVLSFADSSVLDRLDELEGYDPRNPIDENEYIRQTVEIFSLDWQPLGEAWTYLMSIDQVKQLGGMQLPDGCWTGKQQMPPSQPQQFASESLD
jgi:gamma-glutamylcyclotransferase (GGCT)/AIG2-like uncharacterized protein YtfP